MKTAQEWVNQEYEDEQYLEVSRGFAEKLFKQIQSDALRHAADTVYGNGLLHGEGLAAQKSIAAIIEEAQQLEKK